MRAAGLLLALLLAACHQPPQADPKAEPQGAAAANDGDLADDPMRTTIAGPDRPVAAGTLPTPELDGVATAPGRWRIDRATTGDAALFGDGAKGPGFGIRCDRAAGRLLFVRAGTSNAGMLRIITSTGAAGFPAAPRHFAPGVIASVPIGDPFLTNVLAGATGRIGVKLGTAPTFAVPADTVIGRVIGECVALRPAQSS